MKNHLKFEFNSLPQKRIYFFSLIMFSLNCVVKKILKDKDRESIFGANIIVPCPTNHRALSDLGDDLIKRPVR